MTRPGDNFVRSYRSKYYEQKRQKGPKPLENYMDWAEQLDEWEDVGWVDKHPAMSSAEAKRLVAGYAATALKPWAESIEVAFPAEKIERSRCIQAGINKAKRTRDEILRVKKLRQLQRKRAEASLFRAAAKRVPLEIVVDDMARAVMAEVIGTMRYRYGDMATYWGGPSDAK